MPRAEASAPLRFTEWSEFQRWLLGEGTAAPGIRPIWRGQREPRWRLCSPWQRYAHARMERANGRDREALVGELRQEEQQLGCSYQRYLAGLGGPSQEALDGDRELVWALGRHHGLVTPLLDWSESPYVALFFAIADLCRERRGPDYRVELLAQDAIALHRLVPVQGIMGDHDDGSLRLVTRTFDAIARMQAQKGLFTWLESFRHFSLESYVEARGEHGALLQVILAGRPILRDAFRDLRQHTIDWRLIYPDREGAALCANAILERLTDE